MYGISNPHPVTYIAAEIHAFVEVSHLEEVQLISTPGHSGVPINELARKAAKRAALAGTLTTSSRPLTAQLFQDLELDC